MQQLSIGDQILNMPKYLRNNLEKSWASTFYKHIFSQICEERFEILYSKNASRPNVPVNVLIGLLILKENFGLSDEDLVGSLHFDLRYQYALGTTSYEKQPVSINTIYNFRTRVLEFEEETGRDLIKEEIESMAAYMQEEMKIDGKLLRMDSMMISSSCKKLSRIELVYATNLKMIKALNKLNQDLIPDVLKCYLEDGHKNQTIYKTRDKDAVSKLEWLISHSILLKELCINIGEPIVNNDAFMLLIRLLCDQTKLDEEGNCEVKEGKELNSEILQNPSDPDATYREKYVGNIGYVANVVESFNDESGIISHYDYKQNIYSDVKFCEDILHKLGEVQGVNILTDGAYYSYELGQRAKKQGIELTPTELVGKSPSPEKLPYSSFEINKKIQEITLCPNKEKPQMSYFSKDRFTAKFKKEQCDNCPLLPQCQVKKEKKGYSIQFSLKAFSNSAKRKEMGTKNYIQLSNKRAGVEGIPSVMRRKYHVDAMPVRGLLRSKIWFGFKIGAYNFRKLLRHLNKKDVLTFLNSFPFIFSKNLVSIKKVAISIREIEIPYLSKTRVLVG